MFAEVGSKFYQILKTLKRLPKSFEILPQRGEILPNLDTLDSSYVDKNKIKFK